jgi:hypothetical protein
VEYTVAASICGGKYKVLSEKIIGPGKFMPRVFDLMNKNINK